MCRFAGGKAVFAADFFQGKLQVKTLARRDFRPQRIDFLRIAIHQVEHETLEVGRFGNVHRRAGGNISMLAVTRAVCAGFEKLVQHVVFIGRHNQAADRQAHLFGDVSRANVAEIAARHAEADLLVVALRRLEIARKVINHLRDDASPVDRIDRTDMVFFLERSIVLHRLHNVLTIVKHPLHGNIVDILVLQTVHLRTLERAHFAVGRQHKYVHALFTAQRIFRSRTRIAAGCAQDIEFPALFVQHIFKRIAQKLHRHILERQRRAVGQSLDFDAVGQSTHRRDFLRAERRFRISTVQNIAQIVRRNIRNKQAHHLKRQLRIAQTAPLVQSLAADLRITLRQHQTAVGRQSHQQNLAKRFMRRLAARTDIFHDFFSIKTKILPIKTGNPPENHPASRPIPTLIHYKLSDDPDTQRSSEKHYLYKRLKQALTVFTVTDAIARSREEGFKTSINSCADT